MYDTIIIGAGPAGMTAALYVARSNLKVILIEQRGIPGGQMNNTANIENYPGYGNISGSRLAEKMFKPLEKLGVEYLFSHVTKIEDQGLLKRVCAGDEVITAKTIILATGAHYRKLGVLGEQTFRNRGVSYCAVCDGTFFNGEDLLVVGGGDSAVEAAIFLTRFARTVTIVHRRGELRAQKVVQDRAFSNKKIRFVWHTVVKEIKGDDRKVTGVIFEDLNTREQVAVPFGGIFIYVGLNPVSGFIKDLPILDKSGWIITDHNMKTSLSGIFAAGDVRQKDLRQITTAVGDGAIAGRQVYEHITNCVR